MKMIAQRQQAASMMKGLLKNCLRMKRGHFSRHAQKQLKISLLNIAPLGQKQLDQLILNSNWQQALSRIAKNLYPSWKSMPSTNFMRPQWDNAS